MNLVEVWRQINATFRIGLAAAGIILATVLLSKLNCRTDPPVSPPQARVEETYHAVPQARPASAPSDAPKTASGKKARYRGLLTVTIADSSPAAPGSTPTSTERQIRILIPDDDGTPLIAGDSTLHARALYRSIPDPTFRLLPGVLIGATVGQSGRFSPAGGLVLVQAWKRLDLGIGGTREGAGAVAGLELWREWAIQGQYALWRPKGSAGPWSVGIGYRF